MEVPVKVLFQVPKRKYKRAVDRNLIKRRIREIYRLQKSQYLYSFIPDGSTLLLSIVYVGKEIHDFSLMEEKSNKLWLNLVKELQQKLGGNAE